MSKKVPLILTLILTLAAILITFQVTYISLNNKYKDKLNEVIISRNLYNKLAELDAYYKNSYIGELDEKKISDSVMKGYVAGTGDKYGAYLTSEQYTEYMSDMDGSGVGIGVMVTYDIDKGALEVLTVMPDSPALEAGIMSGDMITAVNGVDVYDSGYYDAVNSVKGEAGTDVELKIFRAAENKYEEMDLTVTRANVTYLSVLYHMYEDGITGIVKILGFDLNTPVQFYNAVDTLLSQGASRFVFDVRDNSGGELNSIVSILDYLLPAGPVIRIIDKEGNEEVKTSTDEKSLDMPMMALVNSRTASAAELFASALQDYKKARLVGTVTYGKGVMQAVVPLADNSALIISYRMYAPPFSDNYNGIGVIPDIQIELSEAAAEQNIYKMEDAEDNQLMAAIELLNNTEGNQ